MTRKYRFPDRASAESALAHAEQQVTLHCITLDAILREEFTWTKRFTAKNGAWFEMGIARSNSAHGGVVLCREYYPVNRKPSQDVKWADTWIREMSDYRTGYLPTDEESLAYWDCFTAMRELYNAATKAA